MGANSLYTPAQGAMQIIFSPNRNALQNVDEGLSLALVLLAIRLWLPMVKVGYSVRQKIRTFVHLIITVTLVSKKRPPSALHLFLDFLSASFHCSLETVLHFYPDGISTRSHRHANLSLTLVQVEMRTILSNCPIVGVFVLYDNACPAGTPPIDFQSGQVAFCSASNGFCSPGYWCHVGFDERSSVCCPFASDDPCSLPKSEGTGSLHIPRFFFNQTSRQCETFAYSGRKGNQNNFNPCSEGMPLINRRSNTAVFCNSNEDGACPENYWCHLGATAAMTLCCPGDSDPCLLPQSRGNGNSVLSRWYYNTDTKMCLSFTYTGSGGNQNNFETIEACRSRCPEFQNPCTTGPPHINLNGHITRCGATTPTICPSSYWCHIGADLESSNKALVKRRCCAMATFRKRRHAVVFFIQFFVIHALMETRLVMNKITLYYAA
ncbi:Uncharacterized protein T4E_8402 [Trichinella pseudospiralis]|uniref:BPTI/Kunitz inhibitor domain-containing protein n=1 Tax=Trichinella pseudospiralis TaxID=6337 RepID=A0A0V0XEV4_TRIPS|nr:Uncharacterized protein T4E_8402 [Trichinella pseudospiralis]KRX86571.1 Uncharacterized protein T4E_8402 [Trichinella pseudospiralis]